MLDGSTSSRHHGEGLLALPTFGDTHETDTFDRRSGDARNGAARNSRRHSYFVGAGVMSTIIDFKAALARKRYEQHGLRQVLPNEFVKRAIAAARSVEQRVEFKEKK